MPVVRPLAQTAQLGTEGEAHPCEYMPTARQSLAAHQAAEPLQEESKAKSVQVVSRLQSICLGQLQL
jgi:hypothetical protein